MFIANSNNALLWWVCVCWSKFFFLKRQTTYLTGVFTTNLINLKPVLEFNLLVAMVLRPPKFPAKSLWLESVSTLLWYCPEDTLTDIIASSTLGVTKLKLLPKMRRVLWGLNRSSSVIHSTTYPVRNFILWCLPNKLGATNWVKWFVSLKPTFPLIASVQFSNCVSRLPCPFIKLSADSTIWLISLLFAVSSWVLKL